MQLFHMLCPTAIDGRQLLCHTPKLPVFHRCGWCTSNDLMVCEVQHSKGGKTQNYTLSPIILEVGNGVPPILVSFHLGWFSTSMMGERVSTTYETSVSVFRFSLWLIEPRSFFSRRQGSSRWCLWELPAFTDFPGSKTWELSKRTWGFETTLLSKNHLEKIPEFLQSIWGDFHMPRSSFHQKWKPKSNNSSISSSTSTRFSHQVTYHDPSTGVATAASHHLGKRSSHQSSSPVSFHSLILLMLQKSGDHQWLLVYPIYRVLAPSEVVSRNSEPSTVSSKWN